MLWSIRRLSCHKMENTVISLLFRLQQSMTERESYALTDMIMLTRAVLVHFLTKLLPQSFAVLANICLIQQGQVGQVVIIKLVSATDVRGVASQDFTLGHRN